jgi:hypothetical protein
LSKIPRNPQARHSEALSHRSSAQDCRVGSSEPSFTADGIDRVDAVGWTDNPGVSTSDPVADGPMADRLRALHEHYVDAVNRAVAADRDDLVAELVADYPDEALALLAPGQVDTEPWPSAPARLPSTIRGRPRGVVDHGRAARWISALRAAIW